MTKAGVLQFLQSQRHAVVSTVSPTGAPQAALVGIAVADTFEIVFDALDSTRKVRNIRLNPVVALGDERTVQYEGFADFPGGLELDALRDVYYKCFPEGKTKAWVEGSDLRPHSSDVDSIQ